MAFTKKSRWPFLTNRFFLDYHSMSNTNSGNALTSLFDAIFKTVCRKRACFFLPAVFLLSLLTSWVGMQYQGTPEPKTPEDYARILGAENFAAGRVVSPAYAGDFFLQTYLTLTEPARFPALPPLPSLLLAAGIRLGDPAYGLWVTMGLFVASGAWMLMAFAPSRWVIVGSLFLVFWYGALSYWGQTYSSAAALGIGVNLSFGGIRRFWRTRQSYEIIWLGLGMLWIWFCSPIVFFFAIPIPIFLLGRYCLGKRKIGPVLILMIFGFIGILFQLTYNRSTTGSWGTSPSTLYEETYDRNPFFVWQKPVLPPEYDFWRMEQYDFLVGEVNAKLKPPVGMIWMERIKDSLMFYAGLPCLFLFAGALWLKHSFWCRIFLWSAGIALLPAIVILPFDISYTAPLATSFLLLTIWCLRRIGVTRRRNRWLLPQGVVCFVLFIFFSCALYRGDGHAPSKVISEAAFHRKEIIKHLEKESGSHLVLIRYDPLVAPEIEYVYNGAEPAKQKIIWARWHETRSLVPLFELCEGRKFWMLTVKPTGRPTLRAFKWVPPVKDQ
jgi:hypothetical protein